MSYDFNVPRKISFLIANIVVSLSGNIHPSLHSSGSKSTSARFAFCNRTKLTRNEMFHNGDKIRKHPAITPFFGEQLNLRAFRLLQSYKRGTRCFVLVKKRGIQTSILSFCSLCLCHRHEDSVHVCVRIWRYPFFSLSLVPVNSWSPKWTGGRALKKLMTVVSC